MRYIYIGLYTACRESHIPDSTYLAISLGFSNREKGIFRLGGGGSKV
jgi:hypothetical protein